MRVQKYRIFLTFVAFYGFLAPNGRNRTCRAPMGTSPARHGSTDNETTTGMAKGWKQIGFFTRRERRGIILLLVLLTGALASSRILDSYLAKRNTYPRQQWIEDSLLLDSLVTYLRQPQEKQGQAWEKTRHRKAVRPLTPVTFNPNRADSADFADMGLPGWMARNIVRYREAGGKFRSPDDFRKIYGLTEAQFDTLRPYISIAPEDTARPVVPRLYVPPPDTDSLHRVLKYPPGTIVDLNRADTTELKKIPGIGSGIARMIVGYRQQLGGYHHLEQLGEIHLDYEQLRSWLRVDTTCITPIDANRASVSRLKRHPYINFYQARAIVEHRNKFGTLTGLHQFAFYEEFTPDDMERIRPYLSFE